jgi:hypothetical protein
MLFPRSAMYASLISVTAIVALVAWLILDTLAQRPNAPSLAPRAHEEMRSRPLADDWVSLPSPGAPDEAGRSPSGGRWGQ